MKNPDIMTKQQLKDELEAHGVELPSGRVLKATYVDLYNIHVFNKDSDYFSGRKENIQQRVKTIQRKKLSLAESKKNQKDELNHHSLENSEVQVQVILKSAGDEKSKRKSASVADTSSETCKATKKEPFIDGNNKSTKIKNLDQKTIASKLDSLEDLTNSEIGTRLKNLGQTVGPVTTTTRKVYLKKLKSLLQSGDALMNGDQGSGHEEDHIPPASKTTRRRSARLTRDMEPTVYIDRSLISHDTIQEVQEVVETTESSEAESSVVQQHTNEQPQSPSTDSATSASKPKPTRSERRWIPIWLQVLLTIVIVLFSYLVFHAMEKNPSPLLLSRGHK